MRRGEGEMIRGGDEEGLGRRGGGEMRRGGSERGGRCESASSVSQDKVSSMRACQTQSEVAAQCLTMPILRYRASM